MHKQHHPLTTHQLHLCYIQIFALHREDAAGEQCNFCVSLSFGATALPLFSLRLLGTVSALFRGRR